MPVWPITIDDVQTTRERLRQYLEPTPLRTYAELDREIGHGIRVLVKHENHQPTNAFKVRNGIAALSVLSAEQRARGVIAATRGNHGLGVAYAGCVFDTPVTICVPNGNNPEKNAAMRGLGAEVVESGADYDESVEVAERLMRENGLSMIHSSDNPAVIAGSATITLELIEGANKMREPLDALVVAVGGGSQAVGALTVARALEPSLEVFAVQAENACAIHDSWHAREPLTRPSARTFADGLATRSTYPTTFPALCAGLRDFITVSEAEIADAIRLYIRTTHNLAEGAGAAGLAGLRKLAERLAGKRVGVILSGSNIDQASLRDVLDGRVPAA